MINKTFKITTTAATFALLCAMVAGAAHAKAFMPHAGDHAHPVKAADYKPGNLPVINIKKNGIEFKRSRDGFAYLNGSPMAKDEDNADATAYSSGLFTVIVYKKTGRINAIEDGKNITRLR